MKIISRYKDYYDYLVGINGIDNLMVLDRTKGYYPKFREYENQDEVIKYELMVAGDYYPIWFYKGKSYSTKPELIILNQKLIDTGKEKLFSFRQAWYDYDWFTGYHQNTETEDINKKQGIPTLVRTNRGEWHGCILSEFNMEKYIPATEMYDIIYNWVSQQRDCTVENYQTDKEKILSHGLDYKKSFRHRK